jgi:hypothetical protein
MNPIIIPDAAIADYERRNREWLDRIQPKYDKLPDDLPLDLQQFLEDL